MRKVKVGNRIGETTSVVSYRSGVYPIWFEDSEMVEFIKVFKVIFI